MPFITRGRCAIVTHRMNPAAGPSDADEADRAKFRPDAWFTPARFALGLGLLIAACYPEVLFGMRTFVFRDFGVFGYPLAFHHREAFWQGEMPGWNPYNNCGLPFLAQWNTLTLYPGSLLYLLFPLEWSLGVFCLAHQFLAGLGMYALAQRWTQHRWAAAVAGVAFAGNGLTLNCLMWPNNIAALGWMPWVVLLVERGWREGRRSLLKAVGVGTLQMLTGAPEIILFTWTILAVILAAEWVAARGERRAMFQRGGRFLGIVALVALLSAIQLLPFLELLQHSQRDTNYGADSWAMPLWGWANLLVPLFRCYRSAPGVFFQATQDWTSSYYLGAGVLALAIFAVTAGPRNRCWPLAFLAGSGLLLALGEPGGVLAWAKAAFPPLGLIRFPVKFVVLTIFAVPLLAAFAVARLDAGDRDPALTRRLLGIGVGLVIATGAIVLAAHLHPYPREAFAAVWQSGVSRVVLLGLILGLVAALARGGPWRNQLVPRLALVGLVGFDLLTHAPQLNPTVTPTAYEPGLTRTGMPDQLPENARAFRTRATHDALARSMLTNTLSDYTGRRLALYGDCNLLDRIPSVDGFFSLYLPPQRELWAKLFYAPTNQFPSGLADFMGVTYVSDPAQMLDWRRRPTALPRLTGGQLPVFESPEKTYQRLGEPTFDPLQTVYLPIEARSAVTVTNGTAVRFVRARFEWQRIDTEIEAAAPSIVVVSQSAYPAWRAYVDGRRVPLWTANYAFQAIQVPAGISHVEWVYEDSRFRWGAIISAVTLLGVCVGWRRCGVKPMLNRA